MQENIHISNTSQREIFRYALRKSMPVFFGYIFLGTAFGIMLAEIGYDFIWAFFIALIVYAGSLQFALVSFLASGTPLLTVAVMTLFINSRHIFYGLPFVEKFKVMGKYYPYMIFSLTDETYSILYSCVKERRAQLDNNKALFYISALHQSYWIMGCVLGTLAGQYINFDFTGIDFSMTALFVVILVEQILNDRTNALFPALLGGIVAGSSLLLLGQTAFLLPSLVVTVLIITMHNYWKGSTQVSKVKEDKADD